MNTSGKIIAGLIGLGIVGFGGLKIAENKAEEILRADFERYAKQESEKSGIKLSLKDISVNLLSRRVDAKGFTLTDTKDNVSYKVDVETMDATGIDIVDLFQNPDRIRSETLGLSGLQMFAKSDDPSQKPLKASMETARLSGTNLGELSAELETLDPENSEELLRFIDKVIIGKLLINGISAEVDDATMKLASFEISEIKKSQFKGFAMKDFIVNGEGKKLAGIKEISVLNDDFKYDYPQKSVMQINALSLFIPEERDDVFVNTLHSAGMKEAEVNISAETYLDIDKRLFDYKDLTIDVVNAFTLSLQASLANAPTLEQLKQAQSLSLQMTDPEDDIPEVLQTILQQISLVDFAISLEDQKLIGNALDFHAKEKNTSREALAMGVGMISQQVMQQFIGPEKAGKMAQDVMSLMQKGGKLSLGVKTKNGKPINISSSIPVAMIMPKMLIDQLELSSTHESTAH